MEKLPKIMQNGSKYKQIIRQSEGNVLSWKKNKNAKMENYYTHKKQQQQQQK